MAGERKKKTHKAVGGRGRGRGAALPLVTFQRSSFSGVWEDLTREAKGKGGCEHNCRSWSC